MNKILLIIICIVSLNECSDPRKNSNKAEWEEKMLKEKKQRKSELFKNNNNTKEPILSTGYNLPETLYEEPTHYLLEKLTLNPNAAPYKPVQRPTHASKERIIQTRPNERHVEIYPDSPGASTSNRYYQHQPGPNLKCAKIPPFLEEMQDIALKCNVPIRYEPLFKNYPDFVLISSDILIPKYWNDPQIVLTVAFYKSSGELLNAFHPEWPHPIDPAKYWNPEYLEHVNPENYRSAQRIKEYLETYAADKLIVSFKIGKVLSLFKIRIPDYRIRDLKNLNRFTFAESPYVSKLEDILAHFLITDAARIKRTQPMMFDTKAYYMRKLFLTVRDAWENEIAYYLAVKNAYGGRAKHFTRHFKNNYAGIQLDERNNPERAISAPNPKYLFGIHIKRYEHLNPLFSLISIYDSSFNLVMKTKTKKSTQGVGGIPNETLISGHAQKIEKIAIEKLSHLPPGYRPTIVGFDIYEKLKTIDVYKKLAGCAVYDTKEIFQGRTVCELAVKYLHLDYRDKRLPATSGSDRSYSLCDEKMSTTVKAQIAVVLFKLYSLSNRTGVEPLIL